MQLRLTVSASWQRTSEHRYEVRLAAHEARAEVCVFYWYGDEPDGVDPKAWIERIASADLPPASTLYGVTFSDGHSATGWPVTLIEGGVRKTDDRGQESHAVRLLYCLQVHDAWAAIRVHAPVAHLAGGARTELLRVLDSAQPEQSADEVVALADLLRVSPAASPPRLL
jgi:hypothetical protein